MCDMDAMKNRSIITDGNTIGIKNMSVGFVYYTKAKIVDNKIVVYYEKELIMITGATSDYDADHRLSNPKGNLDYFMCNLVECKIADFNYIPHYVAGETMNVNWTAKCRSVHHPDTIINLKIEPITNSNYLEDCCFYIIPHP